MPRDTQTPSETADAVRQREYRKRRKHGRCCITLEVSGDDLDALNDAGLCAWNESKRDAIAEAVREALDQWKRQNRAKGYA